MEDTATLETLWRFIAVASRDISVVGQRSHGSVHCIDLEEVTSVEFVSQTTFQHNISKVVTSTYSVGIVSMVAVLHLTVAEEIRISQLNTIISVPMAF